MAKGVSSESKTIPKVILPNLGRRFSGVTSTLLQVLPHQQMLIPVVVWGDRFIGKDVPTVGFMELLALSKAAMPRDETRVYHARRNLEMLWGLILKHLFRRRLKLVFTSTAQRKHSRYTRFLYHRMDALITTSDRAGRFLDKPADFVIPHGIAIDSYPFEANKEAAWIASHCSGGGSVSSSPARTAGSWVFLRASVWEAIPKVNRVMDRKTRMTHPTPR